MHKTFARRFVRLLAGTALVAAPLLWASPASAQVESSPRMQALFAQFQKKAATNLAKADAALSGKSMQDIRAEENLAKFPEGEALILSPELGRENDLSTINDFRPDLTINGIKQNGTAYLSLADVAFVTGFPISVDTEKQTASGSLYNEKSVFSLDYPKRTLTLQDRVLPVAADDVIIDGQDMLVKYTALENWFDLRLHPDTQRQAVRLGSLQQLTPVQERLLRQQRRYAQHETHPPEMPYVPPEAQTFTVPRADVTLTQQYSRSGDGADSTHMSTYNVLTANEVMGYQTTGFFSGNQDDQLASVRLNFRKESEKNDLLGPLKARVYEFNDINTVNIPGTGPSGAERGFRASNINERYTLDTETTIDGDAKPGWDVELYRNSVFISGTVVDQNGRYSFEKVALFAGDNNFRIVLYGPSGEVQEESRLITVGANRDGLPGHYNVSLSQEHEQTYEAGTRNGDDTGSLRMAGLYEYQYNDRLALRGGIHSKETQGQRDNYLYAGAVTTSKKLIYNTELIATTDGPFQTRSTVRTNVGQHLLSANTFYRSDGFSEDLVDQSRFDTPSSIGVGVNASGPWFPNLFEATNYDAGAGLGLQDTSTEINANFGLTSFYKGLRFNNRLSGYENMDSRSNPNPSTVTLSSQDQRSLNYLGSVFGRYRGYQWQSGLSYRFIPDASPEEVYTRVNKQFSATVSGDAELRQNFDDSLTTMSLGLGYDTGKVLLNPTLSVNSDGDVDAYLTANFSVAKDPYNGKVTVSSLSLSQMGGVSVFSYLDKNADGTFNGDDEPLQDVVINLPQIGRDLQTDKDGKASLYDLQTSRITDISMEESSAFDPSWTPGIKGYSFRPKLGGMSYFEFPIIRGADMDGTVTMVDRATGNSIPGRDLEVSLYTLDGKRLKRAQTPNDGFFVMSQIPPGIYYLVPEATSSSLAGYRVPERLVVSPDGVLLYGHDMVMTRGYKIPFSFSATNANPSLARRVHVLRESDIARQDVLLRLGDYNSSLAMAFDWYKFRLQTRGWKNAFTPVAKNFDDVARDGKSNLLPLQLRPKQPIRLEDAAALCEKLVDAGFTGCGVDVVTTYQAPAQDAAAAPPQKKG